MKLSIVLSLSPLLVSVEFIIFRRERHRDSPQTAGRVEREGGKSERERKSEVEEGERRRLFDCNDRDRRYRSTLSLRVVASLQP